MTLKTRMKIASRAESKLKILILFKTDLKTLAKDSILTKKSNRCKVYHYTPKKFPAIAAAKNEMVELKLDSYLKRAKTGMIKIL